MRMIIFCNILKKYVFKMSGFKVYWSKRGHYTASSTAGAMPGAGNGEIESCGESPGEAVANLETALIKRRDDLHVETVAFENYFMATFTDGLQMSIEFKDGIMTLATEDKFRKKDLRAHPGFATNKELLIRVYIRWVVGRIANEQQINALVDLALNLDLN